LRRVGKVYARGEDAVGGDLPNLPNVFPNLRRFWAKAWKHVVLRFAVRNGAHDVTFNGCAMWPSLPRVRDV